MIDKFQYQITLHILGATILVRGVYKELIDGVREHFSAAVIEKPWIAPDVIVNCTWRSADKYLFRSRPPGSPSRLDGVAVQEVGSDARDWTSLNPPIPPLDCAVLRNRFFALHAAGVCWEGSACAILLGHRGAGKSTLSLRLVRETGAALLSDENAFIHRRSILVEPFARAIHEWKYDGAMHKVATPAISLIPGRISGPSLITHLIFLNKSEKVHEPIIRLLHPSEVFPELICHHLDSECNPDEAVISLLMLSKNIPSIKVTYAGYEQMDEVQKIIRNWLQIKQEK